ncbi:MAG: DUF4040 domain-containing protein [Peptococcaceae bacterium]|jgi:uncharacterized MnhB-related membrane protein|nr:DUF4040 domain-containing protein [Peptococcaceae bacterium]
MTLFKVLLLLFLIACAAAVSLTRRLLPAIIIFMSYSLVMSLLWALLEAPDLAVTEAAVGAGITSVLFFLALKRVRALRGEENEPPE